MRRVSGGTADATAIAKRGLREQIRRRRRARAEERTPDERHTDADRLAAAVLAGIRAHCGDRVCRVAVYESRPTEPPTEALVQRLHEQGYDVIVPVTLPDRDLDWRSAFDPESAPLGPDAIAGAPVVVVPALAVDRQGHRLGQGGGSYDRSLPRRDRDAQVVALLHDEEVLVDGAVPVGSHDVGVDAVVTPMTGWTRLSPGG